MIQTFTTDVFDIIALHGPLTQLDMTRFLAPEHHSNIEGAVRALLKKRRIEPADVVLAPDGISVYRWRAVT